MPPSPHSPRSLRAPEDQRLSIISEDGDAHVPGSRPVPAVPPRSTHRPFARRWRDAPPRASSELKPPEYSTLEESTQKRDALAELRNKPAISRRGGWKRLFIIIIAMLMILGIGLGVGLGVGLSNRKSQATDRDFGSGSPNISNSNGSFPTGRYAVGAYLDSVETSCTQNPSTFRCYPYNIFNTSQVSSAISFNWIITGNEFGYTISSSDNPFAITFENVTLNLTDEGSDLERYVFSTKLDKVVIPSTPITDDNSQAECFYNGTVLSAFLYTKLNQTNVQTAASVSSDPTAWLNWPYAVEVNQTINGGPGVPLCYERINGAQGSQITSGLAAQSTASKCGCFYKNFEL